MLALPERNVKEDLRFFCVSKYTFHNIQKKKNLISQGMEMMGMMMEMLRKMSDDAAKHETLLLAEFKNLSQGRFEAKQNGEKPPEFDGRLPYAEVKQGCCRLYSGQSDHVGYFLRWIPIRSVSRWLSNSGHNNH